MPAAPAISASHSLEPPNSCKRLTKRRLFARRPVGRLEQSALAGGTPPADPPQDGQAACRGMFAVFSRFAIYATVVRPPVNIRDGYFRTAWSPVRRRSRVARWFEF